MENIQLLIEQANANDAVAQYKLGRAYETGDGVEKNIATARDWYQKSADNGYKNATVKLSVMSAPSEVVAPKSEAPKAYVPPKAPSLVNESGQGSVPASSNSQKSVGKQKSKGIAIILALLLGCYGAHDFYLGYTKQGIIKFVLTITFVGVLVSEIWALIDLVKIICNGKFDSRGQKLK